MFAIVGVRTLIAIVAVSRWIVVAKLRTLVWTGIVNRFKIGTSAKIKLLAWIKLIETKEFQNLALEQKHFVAETVSTRVKNLFCFAIHTDFDFSQTYSK